MYNEKPTVLKGLETTVSDIKPGHYAISDGLSKANGWPVDDTETISATLFVIGSLNNPTTMQGYRVYLLFTNKSQFFIYTQWWEKEINVKGWKKVTLSAIS